jgi:hypothetical protein
VVQHAATPKGGSTQDNIELDEVADWTVGLNELHAEIAECCGRPELQQRALSYLEGLLSPIERKNSWQLAEHAGDRMPDGMQSLLATYQCDADAVWDDLRAHVLAQLAHPRAILVFDETWFLRRAPSQLVCSGDTPAP